MAVYTGGAQAPSTSTLNASALPSILFPPLVASIVLVVAWCLQYNVPACLGERHERISPCESGLQPTAPWPRYWLYHAISWAESDRTATLSAVLQPMPLKRFDYSLLQYSKALLVNCVEQARERSK